MRRTSLHREANCFFEQVRDLSQRSQTTTREKQSRSLTPRKKLLFGLLATLLAVVAVETAARIWLSFLKSPEGQPTVAGEQQRLVQTMRGDLESAEQGQQLYTTDEQLFWKLRPDVRLNVRNNVYQTTGAPVRWEIETNALGFRGPWLPADREQASPLIVCLGDSCTFGFRVDQEKTYPRQLQAYLQAHGLPQALVLNCGVPGYSSFQGARVAQQLLPDLRPDFVVMAFGANDLEPALWTDSQRSRQSVQLPGALSGLRRRLGVARLYDRLFRSQRVAPDASVPSQRRVDEQEYEANLLKMITAAKQVGAEVMVGDLIFIAPVYANQIERLVREQQVEHLDGRVLIQTGLEQVLDGSRFQKQRNSIDQFWDTKLAKYNFVYYSEQYYQRLLSIPQWQGYLRYLLVEPVHPSPLGHQLISEQIGSWILEKSGQQDD